MEAQLAQACTGKNDVDWRADNGDEVERQVDDKLEELDKAPRGVFGVAGGLAQHLDGVGRIGEEEALRGHQVGEAFVD